MEATLSPVKRHKRKCQVNEALAGRRDAAQVSAMAKVLRLNRALVRVSGPDCVSFLQSLLTQNVEAIDGPRYSALLTPQGKVIADMLLWPIDGDIVIEADVARGADLLRRLTMYKLRADVTLTDARDAFGLAFSEAAFEGGAADPRFPDGALGWRKLTSREEAQPLRDGAAAYDAKRLAAAAPDLARDAAPEEVFAGEALLEELHGVDFQKGCFVGQENVSRMKRRATTRRKFCPIVFEGAPSQFGAVITAGDSELGSVRSGMQGRAIALLRLDRALEAAANGTALMAEGRELHLDPPPWLILPQREAE
jgi:folate-binding protein YgfZ